MSDLRNKLELCVLPLSAFIQVYWLRARQLYGPRWPRFHLPNFPSCVSKAMACADCSQAIQYQYCACFLKPKASPISTIIYKRWDLNSCFVRAILSSRLSDPQITWSLLQLKQGNFGYHKQFKQVDNPATRFSSTWIPCSWNTPLHWYCWCPRHHTDWTL